MKKILSLILGGVMLMNVFFTQATVLAEGEPVNVLFRSMDDSDALNNEGAVKRTTSEKRLEGTGSAKFEYTESKGLFFVYVYNQGNTANATDITGAQYMMFDMYIEDISKLHVSDSGDFGIGVRDSSDGWNSNAGRVSKDDYKNALSSLKNGWNHLVLPLNSGANSNAMAYRMFSTASSVDAGFTFMLDDVRFVNGAYLESEEYANITAAKAVSALIGELTAESNNIQIAEARDAYDKLDNVQKAFVANYDHLLAVEKGEVVEHKFLTLDKSNIVEPVERDDTEFTLAVIGDIHYAGDYDGQEKQVFFDTTKWIADNAEKENIQMVLQMGDMTSGHSTAQWNIAKQGFATLEEKGISYALTLGNHDYDGMGVTVSYNRAFPFEKMSQDKYYSGAKAEGDSNNLYYEFTQNGTKYMVLSIQCYPEEDVLKWADEVIKAHADSKVIIMTHSYLRQGGGGYGIDTEALSKGFRGETVWNSIVRCNDNVFMVLCGHNTIENGDIYRYNDINDFGHVVYQYQIDSQDFESIYGGLGAVALIRFSDGGKTISFDYYSTRYGGNFHSVNSFQEFIDLTMGDVNSDGDITAADALLALQQSVGKIELASRAAAAADVDKNSDVTAADALKILQYSVGKIKEL